MRLFVSAIFIFSPETMTGRNGSKTKNCVFSWHGEAVLGTTGYGNHCLPTAVLCYLSSCSLSNVHRLVYCVLGNNVFGVHPDLIFSVV